MRPISGCLLMSLAVACTQTLDGAPCPCADGYVCCQTQQVCLREGAACLAVGAAGRGGSDAGASAVAGAPSGAGGTSGAAGAPPAGGGAGGDGGHGGGDAVAGSGGNPALAGAGGSAGAAGGGGFGGALAGSGSAGASSGGDTGGGGAAGSPDAEPSFVLVATQHNDTSRTGANVGETALDTSNVAERFGESSRRRLRGAVFAQPLVVPGVALEDGSHHDVLVVATMANVVYGLDARHPEEPPFWSRELGSPVGLPSVAIPYGAHGIWHEVGILGTPVVSAEESAVYAVAATRTGDVAAHTAYKLDLATGAVLDSAPITADGFDSTIEVQRAALTLKDGVLYVPFGAYLSGAGASGWLFSFDRELAPLGGIKLGAPNGAGVTMGGDGPAVAANGSLYFTTGLNGDGYDMAPTGYGARVLELTSSEPAELIERLVPAAAQTNSDEVASSGPVLLPGTERLLVAGQHRLYVVDAHASAASPPFQELRVSAATMTCSDITSYCAAEPSSPVFWPGSGAAPVPRAFVWSPNDLLRSFRFDDGGRIDCDGGATSCTPFAATSPNDSYDSDGVTLPARSRLSVSSNGAEPGTGVVWALSPFAAEGGRSPDGILRAFEAEGLQSLWTSERANEPVGPLARGAVPTVSGGRVFVGQADGLSNKTVIWRSQTGGAPALANYQDELLVVAWAFITANNQGFQLAWSSDGVGFEQASTIFATFATFEPALATNGGRIYFGWTTLDQRINVITAEDPSFVERASVLDAGASDYPFEGPARTGPALAYGNGRLFLAWHTDSGLEVVSGVEGAEFDLATRVTLEGYHSWSAPLLAYQAGKLYLASADYDGHVNLFVSTDEGAHWAEPSLLPMLSAGHPALVSFEDDEPEQVLFWTSALSSGASEGQIAAATRPGFAGDFSRLHVFQEDSAQRSVSAAFFRGSAYIAWMGTGGAPQPNVARYSTGGLVTYGLRAR